MDLDLGAYPKILGLGEVERLIRRIERDLRASGCDLLTLGYEDMALAPESTFRRLCDWLDLPYDNRMLTPGVATPSHIISGDRMRNHPKRTSRVVYDGTWLTSPSLVLGTALALPPLAAMNRRLV